MCNLILKMVSGSLYGSGDTVVLKICHCFGGPYKGAGLSTHTLRYNANRYIPFLSLSMMFPAAKEYPVCRTYIFRHAPPKYEKIDHFFQNKTKCYVHVYMNNFKYDVHVCV